MHRLVAGRKLILGGVEIPHETGLLGHSDADALLHAITDALLGAVALGDIGCHSMSGIFSALKIEHAAATWLVKDTGDTTDEMFPRSSIIGWDIPARQSMPACRLFWYDGGLYPPREVGELADGQEYPDNGMIVVGGLVLGALLGGLIAKRRGGKPADIAQYAAAYGIAFAILGLFLSIAIERLAAA